MERLQKKLLAIGYSPGVDEIKLASSGRWYRVTLEGFSTSSEARQVSASLEKKIRGLKCLVIRQKKWQNTKHEIRNNIKWPKSKTMCCFEHLILTSSQKVKNLPSCHSRESGNPVITSSYGFPIRPVLGSDRGSGMTKRQKFGLFTKLSIFEFRICFGFRNSDFVF